VFNFAQGMFAVCGAYFAATALSILPLPSALAVADSGASTRRRELSNLSDKPIVGARPLSYAFYLMIASRDRFVVSMTTPMMKMP